MLEPLGIPADAEALYVVLASLDEGAAVDPAQQSVGVEAVDVAAHGHVRHAHALDQVGDADDVAFGQAGQDELLAFSGDHGTARR